MTKKIIFVIAALLINSSVSYCVDLTSFDKDTVIVKYDSLNKTGNSFDLILLYRIKNKEIEVYRIKNQDYSVELRYISDYSNLDKRFSLFFIEDLPTGQNKAIYFNKKESSFYISDWYDDGGGELLLFWTVNFKTLKVESILTSLNNCGRRREINISKIKVMPPPR